MSTVNVILTFMVTIILVLQEAYLLGIMALQAGILMELDSFNRKGTESD